MSNSEAQRGPSGRRAPWWLWLMLAGYVGVVASIIVDVVARPSAGRIAWDLLQALAVGLATWLMWRWVRERRARGVPLGLISGLRHDFGVFRKDNLRRRISEATSEFLAADEQVVSTAFAGLSLLGTRPVFLALTDKRLIVQRVSPFTMEAAGLLFADPRNEVSVVNFRRWLWPGSLLWVRRGSGETIRFVFPNLPARWRREAEKLVAGLA